MGLEKQKLTEGKEIIRYFCSPCKPTAVNGQRTRNLPEHEPEKWEAFKAYNRRDVEAELSIQERLARFPVPNNVWAEYSHDQEINDRGVALDMTLVRNAIKADTRSRTELTRLMKELTNLDNPNSVQQMKGWLADNGMETDSLGKKAVADLLKDAPEPLGKVLSLRQQLAKSSVKKYQTMENAICVDGRARGMFQFYGANRTGRWAGRLIQMQNLPQNHLTDLEEARSLVRNGDFDALALLYDNIPDVLSQLIRTAFVPKDGHKLIVADFSAIEARVIAWLAGERWRNYVFATHGKIYEASASHICGDCGGRFGKKVWGSYKGDKTYRKEVWQCNDKYKRLGNPGKGCQTPHIIEDEIKKRFLTAFNQLMHDRDGLIEDCRLAQNVLCDTTTIDTELAELFREIEVVTELSRKGIYENARTAVNQTEWAERNNAYLERHREASERVDELEAAKRERLGKGKIIEGFIKDIENRPLAIDDFDEKLWLAVIDQVTVDRDGSMTFRFKNGSEVTA